MNRNDDLPTETDEVSAILEKWTVSAELPVDFKSRVWRSISRAEATQPKGLERWVGMALVPGNLKRIVVGYLCLAVFTGVYLGLAHAKNESDAFHYKMGQRYVSLVDPYAHTNR